MTQQRLTEIYHETEQLKRKLAEYNVIPGHVSRDDLLYYKSVLVDIRNRALELRQEYRQCLMKS